MALSERHDIMCAPLYDEGLPYTPSQGQTLIYSKVYQSILMISPMHTLLLALSIPVCDCIVNICFFISFCAPCAFGELCVCSITYSVSVEHVKIYLFFCGPRTATKYGVRREVRILTVGENPNLVKATCNYSIIHNGQI